MKHIAWLGCLGVAALLGCGDNLPSPVDKDCDVSGHACTWLGIPGATAFNGDGHDRLSTALYWTMDMVFATDGTVWFIDWNNHLVRKIGTDGKIVSVVGWDDPVFPGDGDPNNPTAEKSPAGDIGTDVQLNHPTYLLQQADGTILIAAWHNHKLRKADLSGNDWIVAGGPSGFKGDGGPVAMALFNRPSSMTFDDAQNLYIVDQVNQRVRRVDAQTQMITTVAGTGVKGFTGDGGPATMAAVAFDNGDNPEPSGSVAYANGVLYIADTINNRIRSVDVSTGIINTIAGTGDVGYSGDGGPAIAATFYSPRGLKIGPEGDLYVTDTDNGVIRAIDLTTGNIRRVAGNHSLGLDPEDDLLATETQLNRPFGVDFDPQGVLYISDSLNSRVLRVAP